MKRPTFQNHLRPGVNEQMYETGCLVTMEQWFNANLYAIGGAAIGVAVIQVSFYEHPFGGCIELLTHQEEAYLGSYPANTHTRV